MPLSILQMPFRRTAPEKGPLFVWISRVALPHLFGFSEPPFFLSWVDLERSCGRISYPPVHQGFQVRGLEMNFGSRIFVASGPRWLLRSHDIPHGGQKDF